MNRDLLKEYNLKRSLWERASKRIFNCVYSMYRPKIGDLRVRVDKPFRLVLADGTLSEQEYIYSRGKTTTLTEIGLFVRTGNAKGYTRHVNDLLLVNNGKHMEIEYVEEPL